MMEKERGKPGGAPSTGCIQWVPGKGDRDMGQLVQGLQGREGVGKMSSGGGEAPGGRWAGSHISDLSEDTSLEVNTYEAPVPLLTHVVST